MSTEAAEKKKRVQPKCMAMNEDGTAQCTRGPSTSLRFASNDASELLKASVPMMPDMVYLMLWVKCMGYADFDAVPERWGRGKKSAGEDEFSFFFSWSRLARAAGRGSPLFARPVLVLTACLAVSISKICHKPVKAEQRASLAL